MADNENFSANIEVNVDLNTTAAEAKLKQLAGKTKAAQDALAKIEVESKSERGKKARPATADTMFKKAEKELESAVPNIKEFKKAFIDGTSSLIPAFNDLAENLRQAGYKLNLNAKTGQVEVARTKSPSQQKEAALKGISYSGGNQIISSSDIMRNLDVAKLQNEIRKELGNLGLTGIGKYVVGSIETRLDDVLKVGKAPKAAGFDDDLVEQIEMAEGGALDRILQDFSAQAVREINEQAEEIAQYAKIRTTDNKAFVPTEMSELLAQEKIDPKYMSEQIIQDAADFIPGAKGQPIISPEIFMLAVKRAMGNLGTGGIPATALATQISDASEAEMKIEISEIISQYIDGGVEGIERGIDKVFKKYSYTGEGKNRGKPRVTPAEQNQRLIEQFNLLSPQQPITSFDKIIDQYFDWVIENKIVPSLEKTAHGSVKKMAQGNSRYNDLMSAGDLGAENFAEFQQRAVQRALPELSSKYGVPVQSITASTALRDNSLLEPMVKIAAVSGEVATSMKDIDKEFYTTEEHLRNFNKFLEAMIQSKLPEAGMSKRELGRAAKEANKEVAPTAAAAPVAAKKATSASDIELAALSKLENGDVMQQMKKIIGAADFNKIFAFIENTVKAGGKLGDVIAGWDTEFAPGLNQVANTILESSVVLRNAQGEFADIQTFMHRPAYNDPKSGIGGVAGVNQKMYLKDPSAGIGNVSAFMKRAAELGIPESELGNTKDFAANTAEASKKFRALQAIFVALDNLNIPLTGQKIIGADFEQFRKTMEWLSKFTDQIHLTTGLKNVSDNLAILQKMQTMTGKNDPGMSIAGGKGTDLKQSSIVQALFKQFPAEMEKYSKFIQPTQNGFKVTIDNKEFKAHTAQADAIASVIVNQVMRTISPTFAALMAGGREAYLPADSKFAGDQFPYSTETLKDTKVKINPQARAAEANELVRATRAQDDAQRELVKSMAGMNVAVPLFEKIKAIISGTAGETSEANNALKPLLRSMSEMLDIQKASLTGKRLNANEKVELERINKLQAAFNDLHDVTISKGNKVVENRLQLKKIQHLISDEYGKQIAQVEELRKLQDAPKQDKIGGKGYHNLGRAVMQPFEEAQAGPVFGKEIQAQMKDYVTREKQVESANKNLINTWVTARYALYDVANAYQNVSRNMLMATRAMFNMTQSYRSFETAFTPVERAMSLTEMEVVDLRDQFIKLSETIPVSFQDLSAVATLGAQMGVTADGIVRFTDTVTKFASVTGVSADTVAQKFGRIGQLTKIDPSQYENLGSAISFAGVNAVATEAEILSLAESIAASSNRVGITADEVIGLSTSLASLGIAPEQARGVFTRVFADIDRAVAKGGSQLSEFSKVSGMSSADFKKQWGTPGQSYEVFRRILQGLNKSGKDMTQTFDDLNLTETREVNTLTRLATNLDVVDSSMTNATSSFAANTFLSDSFAKTVDNLDSKLKIFKNRIDSLTASLSKGFVATLSTLLDVGSKVADMLKILANNQIIQWATSFGTAFLGLSAVGAGIVSVMAKIVAQIYAFRVASINAANDPTAVVGWNKQLKALTNFKSEIIEMRDQISLSSTSSSVRGQIQPVDYPVKGANDRNKYLLETEKIYRSTGEAAIKSANDAGAAHNMKKMAAFEALTWARKEADQINHIVAIRAVEMAQLQASTSEKVASGAMTAAQAEAIMVEARSRQINYEWINGEAKAISLQTELQAVGVAETGVVTKAKQAEAAAHLQNKLAIEAETKAGAVGKGGVLGGVGAKIMGVAGGIGLAVTAATTLYAVFEMIRGSMEEASKINLLESGGGIASLREAIKKDTAEYEKSGEAIRTVVNEVQTQGKTIDTTKVKIAGMVGAQDQLNTSIATGTDNVKSQTVAIGENTKAWVANALIQNEKLQQMMANNPTMLDDLKESGIDFKTVMQDVLSGKNVNDDLEKKLLKVKGALAAETQAYFSDIKKVRSLERQAKALQGLIAISGELGGALKSATQESQVSTIIQELLGVEDAAGLADDQVKTLTKTLRTLSNYADDVGSVFTNMLKFKFQKQNALADVRAATDGINKGIKDATKNLRDLNNTLTSNSKKKKQLEVSYQLAVQFGDTERAKEIADEIASVDAELSNNQTDISYNQQLLTGTLDTTTQAGRDNDKTLQGLITTNGEYIKTLIDSGASQATINKAIADGEASFRAQAAAMGISTEATNKYAKAFDGFKKIVKGVPKNVNINANTDPAKRALEEFVKLANGTTVLIKVKTDSDATGPTKAERKKALEAERDRMTRALTLRYVKEDAYLTDYYKGGIKAINSQISAGTYASGGFVSGPGSSTSDSIPARLSNGEFVIRANSVSKYGLDFMNSLNQQRVGYAPVQQMQNNAGNSGSGVVYLSSRDRELLQAVIDRPITLRTTNRVIAESANDGNRELARRGKN